MTTLNSLPLSWARARVVEPQFTVVRLPLSGAAWIPVADVPFHMPFNVIYNRLAELQGNGFVLQLCNRALSRFVTRRGGQALQVGLEAVLPLQKDHQFKPSVEALARRGLRHGRVREVLAGPNSDGALARLAAASRHGRKPQLAFAYRTRLESGGRGFALVTSGGDWLGAVTLSRASQTGLHTELLLRHRAAPVGVMEALVLHVFSVLQAEGWTQWSLGGVPFASMDDLPGVKGGGPGYRQRLQKSHVVNQAGRTLKFAYNYRGLLNFKAKFTPRWEPLFLCGSRGLSWAMLFDLAHKSRYFHLVGRQAHNRMLNI